MPEFPIMATDDGGMIHRIGYDGTGRIWTACGLRAEQFGTILAYEPDCPTCIEVLAQPPRHIDGYGSDDAQV